MESFIIFIIGLILGVVLTKLCTKKDGRIVLGGDKYFVGIKTAPEEIAKKKTITLKVVKQ